MVSQNLKKDEVAGVGMTSQRTRHRLSEQLRTMGIDNDVILNLVQSIPRHLFIDEALSSRAYENTALPIGYGQTISQPYTVALMTQILFNIPRANVLEIGSGCGYQTVFLSALSEQVVSLERIIKLHRKARDICYDLGVRNVMFRHGDGFAGFSDKAPFDGILAAAVSSDVPDELLQQLAVGGRLVMPLGHGDHQVLIVVDKTDNGIEKKEVETVRFVPRLAGLG